MLTIVSRNLLAIPIFHSPEDTHWVKILVITELLRCSLRGQRGRVHVRGVLPCTWLQWRLSRLAKKKEVDAYVISTNSGYQIVIVSDGLKLIVARQIFIMRAIIWIGCRLRLSVQFH